MEMLHDGGLEDLVIVKFAWTDLGEKMRRRKHGCDAHACSSWIRVGSIAASTSAGPMTPVRPVNTNSCTSSSHASSSADTSDDKSLNGRSAPSASATDSRERPSAAG